MTTNYFKVDELEAELMEDREYREARERLNRDSSYIIGRKVIEARIFKGMTQKELARLVDTHQSAIARLESGRISPNIKTLEKFAKALGTSLVLPEFGFDNEIEEYKMRQSFDVSNVENSYFTMVSNGAQGGPWFGGSAVVMNHGLLPLDTKVAVEQTNTELIPVRNS